MRLSVIFCNLKQRLFFIIGKGGVGRSSVASSLATHYSQKKENVLLVQWSLSDAISPLFSHPAVGHKSHKIKVDFSSHKEDIYFETMNFSADEAIKEYFVDHLKMKLLYSVIIQNKHVKKLIQAAPGISELFFLGRLFWLVELAQKERGVFYHRIIVDTPATGHGISLFSIAKAVGNLGITGPLALECERVAKLLADKQKTATIFVTLPEELPIEECMESVPKVTQKLGYSPSLLILNQSVNVNLFPHLKNLDLKLKSTDLILNEGLDDDWLLSLMRNLTSHQATKSLANLVSTLLKRNHYEKKIEEFAKLNNIPLFSIPDFNLLNKKNSALQILNFMHQFFNSPEVYS